mgnify:CR=1 FL=1
MLTIAFSCGNICKHSRERQREDVSSWKKCKKLKKVTLPNTLYSIQQNAFLDTVNLTEIKFDGTLDEFKHIRLGWNAFGTEILGRNGKKLIAKDGVINL